MFGKIGRLASEVLLQLIVSKCMPMLLFGLEACTLNRSQLKGSVKEPNISIYLFFPRITQWCSISNVLFTGGSGVSDFSVFS